MELLAKGQTISFNERPLLMGIVNVTPDSFFDGGRFLDPQAAVAHAVRLVEEGADLLDIGAESTRPGAAPVEETEERRRLIPVVTAVEGRVRPYFRRYVESCRRTGRNRGGGDNCERRHSLTW